LPGVLHVPLPTVGTFQLRTTSGPPGETPPKSDRSTDGVPANPALLPAAKMSADPILCRLIDRRGANVLCIIAPSLLQKLATKPSGIGPLSTATFRQPEPPKDRAARAYHISGLLPPRAGAPGTVGNPREIA
jgi:hypothetical protein